MKPLWIFCLATALGDSACDATNAFPVFQVAHARDYLQTVSEALPAESGTNAETCYLRAQIQSQLGRKDKAEHLARQALACDTNRADIELFLANLLIRQDHLQEAADCLRAAVQVQPAIPTGYSQLGMVMDRLGDHKAAQEAFQEAVRLTPQNATAHLLLGRLLLDQDRVEGALEQLQKACQLDPELASARYALFQAQTKQGDQEAAQKSLGLFEQLKQKEQAAMDNENAASDSETHLREVAASLHVGAATLLGRQGKEDQAEAHLLEAVRIAPEEPQAYELLTQLYLKREQLYSARKSLEELIRLRPNDVTYGVNLGTVLLQLRDFPAAMTQFKRVLGINPKEPAALNNLARVYLETHRELPAALAMSRQLVAGDPNGANYDLLGWAFYANGQTNEAIRACAKAMEKDPANAVYRERYRRLLRVAPAP